MTLYLYLDDDGDTYIAKSMDAVKKNEGLSVCSDVLEPLGVRFPLVSDAFYGSGNALVFPLTVEVGKLSALKAEYAEGPVPADWIKKPRTVRRKK